MMRKTHAVGLNQLKGFSLLNNGQRVNVILTNLAVHSPLSVMLGLANSVLNVATIRIPLQHAKHILKITRYSHCVRLALWGFIPNAVITVIQLVLRLE